MTEAAPSTAQVAIRGARRVAIIAVIVSLAIAALIGIITLLTGDFGETQGRILLTTLLLAGFSVTALCHLAVVGRTLRVVGYVGIAVSVVAFLCGAVLIWADWGDFGGLDDLFKAFGAFSILAVSFAHANLLLLLGERKRPFIRLGLFVTVGLIAVVATMLILPIVTEGDIPGDNEFYWRIFGVIAILDVLGTIALPVASRFLRDDDTVSAPDSGGLVAVTVQLPRELVGRLDEEATTRSVSRDQVVADRLERAEG